ncbi:MAG: response regulator transcription factor [Alphaproteobacteria bacterium]|uniref:response regulator transcription factor n=1 Tax=Nisaea sp. TaxID=2024842 RepID=UPI003267CAD2
MNSQPNILIVEDEDIVRTLLAAQLKSAGNTVTQARSGAEMAQSLHNGRFDLILLDLGLPDEDGIVLLRQLRSRSDVPVVVLTSRDEVEIRQMALELGADDYVHKDVAAEELLLRVRNILNRVAGSRGASRSDAADDVLEFADWRLDIGARVLTDPNGVNVPLTRAEFDILEMLARAPNRVLSRDQLLDGLMRSDEAPTDRMIDSYVSRIRRKMGTSDFIITVTGIGYRFVPSPS